MVSRHGKLYVCGVKCGRAQGGSPRGDYAHDPSSLRTCSAALLGTAALAAASGCGSTRPASDWPLPNADLASTRSAPRAGISRANVATLRPLWRHRFAIRPRESGVFTATPVISGGVVYLQDMESNVAALDLGRGERLWLHRFNAGNPGPNGVALADGRLYGATDTTAFALTLRTGRLVWQRRLLSRHESFVDTAPAVANGLVYLSTTGYAPGTRGALYALDAVRGTIRWRFETIKLPWRYPLEAGGGAAWYPPSVDPDGRIYWGTANPIPWGGTRARPNGGSFPGPALYTDSLLVLDGATGRLLWYDQVTPHDVRDYDFQVSPILATLGAGADERNVVFGAGKAGRVIAWDRDSRRRLWDIRVGLH